MAFDYNRNKGGHGSSGDSFWTSYSDLFLGLSTIFLLLYVTSSLRTGTDAIKAQVDNQKLTMQVEELRSQLKMYEQVKTDYLEKSASKDEMQEYNELMDKLTLLKEEAKSDQERLAREALENDKKAVALTKYQQMVRNIINANKVAKTKIQNRNVVIHEQDQTIDEQQQNIEGLESEVAQKKAAIEAQERKIEDAKEALEQNKKRLLSAYKEKQLTKKQFEEKTRKLQEQAQEKIEQMQAVNQTYSQQLDKLSSDLQGTQKALLGTQQALTGTQAALERKAQEAQAARGDAQAARGEAAAARGEAEGLKGQIDAIKGQYAADRASARAALDAEIRKGKMDAAERARREGEFRAAAARKESEMQGKIAGLSGQLKDTEGQLAKAKEEMDARRDIAREIKKGFAAAGIKADVDMGTGEVVLDFGDSYFDSDSANLKPQMKDVIERAMPVYSKSLFGNSKVANKISSVEVVGFASPTYKGRFVDPRSGKAEDKAALKYNMDLSYRRANSIFTYLVNNKDGEFAHQQDLLALMKVSGRSFLEVMKVQGRSPSSAAEFCKVNDCKKAQKVIVRFSMDGKK
ncbi:MAG: microtubule-binding protein [Bdellovibrionales bacterium]|nr:microtubule-binding protein [Bdellovibrionales bacterium]